MLLDTADVNEIVRRLLNKEVGLLPTDTIYGVHGLMNEAAIKERIYQIKKRPESMPHITLISNLNQLEPFTIKIDKYTKQQMKIYWPGANTLILDCDDGIARSFRLPNNEFLVGVIDKAGPLISTSANLHGAETPKTIEECEKLFGDQVDFYVDGGELNNPPSNIYKISNEQTIKIR